MPYPVMLNVAGKTCLIVGGGRVAMRKINNLLSAGARVVVISPTLSGDVSLEIEWRQQHYQSELLTEYAPLLVFAATNDPRVNQQVVADAQKLGVLVNRADHSAASDFANMMTIQRTPITVGISTDGYSPALGRHLKTQLEAVIGDEYAVLAQWLGELRQQMDHADTTQQQRQQVYETILTSDILGLLKAQQVEMAYARFQTLVKEAECLV